MAKKPKLISMHDAAKQGVTKLRQAQWSGKGDYIEIHIHDQASGTMGPWVKLFAGHTVEGVANPTPMLISNFDTRAADWQPHQPT